MVQYLNKIKEELENRTKPILVGVSDGLVEERILVNSFYPRPRIYFLDYVKAHPRGLIFPEDYCTRQNVTQPVYLEKEGLLTSSQNWGHPDYEENDLMKGFNPDFSPWYVFHIKGSTTAVNQIIFSAFSNLVRWSFDLAIAKNAKLVEVSTRYMLYSSNNPENGVILTGDITELQNKYNVYVHLIPEITFFHVVDSIDPPKTSSPSLEALSVDPVLDLHPDLLAMFDRESG